MLDAAYDTAPRELRRNWVPLVSLVLVAVVLTTAAVALAGWTLGGLPLGAAIALGAIVAPPDAAAASAVLGQFQLPRRTLTVLQGESLLNDAVALLIFGAAVAATTASAGFTPLSLVLAVPGGLAARVALGQALLEAGALPGRNDVVHRGAIHRDLWPLGDRRAAPSLADPRGGGPTR